MSARGAGGGGRFRRATIDVTLLNLERFAIAYRKRWRELFTRARFLIRRGYKQGD